MVKIDIDTSGLFRAVIYIYIYSFTNYYIMHKYIYSDKNIFLNDLFIVVLFCMYIVHARFTSKRQKIHMVQVLQISVNLSISNIRHLVRRGRLYIQ